MAFVHGHARDTGWVVAHVRAPVEAEDGQLPLVLDPADPADPGPEEAPQGGRAGEPLGPAERSSTARG